MNKIICAAVALFLVLTTITIPAFAQDEIKVIVNGEQVVFPDTNSVIVNGRTLVPVRAIFEKMGLEVDWDSQTRTVIGKKEGLVIKLPIDNKYANKNGEDIELDVPASIVEGRTMVPVRFIADSVEAKTNWDGENKTVLISSKDEPKYKLFNEVLRIGDNTFVTISYNYELATIASAVASKFNHQGYLTPNLDIRNKVIRHFGNFTDLESAKKIYEYAIPKEVMPLKLLYSITPFLTSVNTFQNEISINTKNFPKPEKSSINSIEELNTLMNDFKNETNAALFFEENYDFYKNMFTTFKNNYAFNFVERLSNFFGYENNEKFIIYLTATKSGGRSSYLFDQNGIKHNLNIINILFDDSEISLNTIYHEAAHNFLHQAIESNRTEFEKYGETINSVLSDNERLYENKFDETVVRAIVVLMLEKYHGAELAERNLNMQINRGWKNTDKVYNFIKDNYVENKYKTFNDFFPELLKYLEELNEYHAL